MMNTHRAPFRYAGFDQPNHAKAPWERVAYCVAGEMRQAVATALRLGKFEPVEVPVPDILSAPLEDQHCVALIHDLHPWDGNGTRQVERVRQQHPSLPILVYAPNRVGIADLLLRCACLYGVRAELQQTFSTREADRLRSLIVSVIGVGPRARVLQMIQSVDPDAPTRAWTFIELALRSMGTQTSTRRLTVGELAKGLDVSERTLERSWRNAALPPPKNCLNGLRCSCRRCYRRKVESRWQVLLGSLDWIRSSYTAFASGCCLRCCALRGKTSIRCFSRL